MNKSSGMHYQLIAISLGLILFSGSISGSASVVYADKDDDRKEKFKKLLEFLKKLRDKHKNGKILVCHNTSDDPNKAHTISISKRALSSHLRHGDTIGECDKYDDKRDKKDPEIKITSPKKIKGPDITITGTAKDDGTGVETVKVRLGYGGYKTADLDSDGTWTVEFTDVSKRYHKITAKAVDFAGNDKRTSTYIKVT